MSAFEETMSGRTKDITGNTEGVTNPVLHKHNCTHLPDITGLRAQIIDNFTIINGRHSDKSEWSGGKVNSIQIVTLGEAPNIRAAVFLGTSTIKACGEPAATTAGALQNLLVYTERKIHDIYDLLMLRKKIRLSVPSPPPTTPVSGVKYYTKVSSEMHEHDPFTSKFSKGIYMDSEGNKGFSLNDIMAMHGYESGGVPVGGVHLKNDSVNSTATTDSRSSFASQIDLGPILERPRVLPSEVPSIYKRPVLPSSPSPIPTIFQTDFDRRPFEYAQPPKTPEPKTPDPKISATAVKKQCIPGLTPEQHDSLWSSSAVKNPGFRSNVSDDDDEIMSQPERFYKFGFNDDGTFTDYAFGKRDGGKKANGGVGGRRF